MTESNDSKVLSILENRFTPTRIIGGKPRKIVVDKNGNIIDRNPSKEELKGLKERTGKKRGRSNKYTDEELLEYQSTVIIETVIT